jgi:hypothetical protein
MKENSMDRKKQIRTPDGREIEATIIDINSSQENWNQYLLSDGTVVKLKVVATEAVRVDGEYDAEGNPIYFVKSTNVMNVIAPDNLRKKHS